MDSCGDTPKGWVAPFGHPRINACSRLPVAFRSVPRPSSPPGAKASTECPSLARDISSRTEVRGSTMHRNHPQKPPTLSPSVNPKNQPSTKRTATAQSRNHSCSAHNSSPLNTAPSLDAETSGQTSRWSRPETHQNLIHIYKDLPPDRHHRTRSDDHPRAGAPNLETPPASQLHIETINTDCFRFSAIPTRTTPSPKWWR